MRISAVSCFPKIIVLGMRETGGGKGSKYPQLLSKYVLWMLRLYGERCFVRGTNCEKWGRRNKPRWGRQFQPLILFLKN